MTRNWHSWVGNVMHILFLPIMLSQHFPKPFCKVSEFAGNTGRKGWSKTWQLKQFLQQAKQRKFVK
jgi:hypothetical protein